MIFPSRKPNELKNMIVDKSAHFLAKGINACRNLFVRFMSNQESKLTLKQKKIGLIIFLIAMSAYSSALIFDALRRQPPSSHLHGNQGFISLPIDTRLPDSLDLNLLRQLRAMRDMPSKLKDTIHP